jgi:hypothetical protein
MLRFAVEVRGAPKQQQKRKRRRKPNKDYNIYFVKSAPFGQKKKQLYVGGNRDQDSVWKNSLFYTIA